MFVDRDDQGRIIALYANPQREGHEWVDGAEIYIDETAVIAAKVEALWSAANSYESGYISGVGLSILTVGVLQSKPKALAVKAWSKALWTEYYARKSAITFTSEDNHDFSAFGPMPHTVPELQEEVGL